MQISEFEAALAKGLGRPLLYVQDHNARPYRDAILHACTHNLVYDRQCEEGRAPYLFELLHLTREPDFYREKILSALLAPAEDEDVSQMLGIVRRFAQQGDSLARQAVYSAIIQDAAENEFHDADELIELDGIEGLLFVVEYYLAAEPEDEDWRPGWWVDLLAERDGKATAWQAMTQAASRLPTFAKWLQAVRHSKRTQADQRRKRLRQPRPDYASLRALIEKKGRRAPVSRGWAESASAEELQQAATDLLAETNEDRLYAYLKIFRWVPFPSQHLRLIEIARTYQNQKDHLASAAMKALSRIGHSEIRVFALTLMEQPYWYREAIEMLSQNYQEGDYHLVESLLEQKLDPDDYHDLGFGVEHFAEAHPTPESERSLLLLYENGPCSLCRNGCVDQLIALNRLPEWMREECQYDADSATRRAIL